MILPRILHPDLVQVADDIAEAVVRYSAPGHQLNGASFLPVPEAAGAAVRDRRELHLSAERLSGGEAS